MPTFIDITGHRYGRWAVVARVTGRRGYWLCRCDCGNIGEVSRGNLRSGQSGSCGCQAVEATRARRTKHGATAGGANPPEYKAWRQAKLRCYSTKNPDYRHYGGRGIRMCDRWRDDFAAFLADMGPRPTGYTLDRVDVNGDYGPANCRWASRYTQSNNTRQCVYVMHLGERMTMSQLAAKYGVDYAAVRQRIRYRKQTPEQAIFALLHGRKRRTKRAA